MRAISSKLVLLLAAFLFVLTACGGDDTSSDGGQPTVVVTTNILGDVVRQVAGDQVNVETIMPAGADPHVFQASAQQVDLMMKADLLISNGEDFEERLLDVLASAEEDGVPVFEAMSHVRALEFGEDDHDDHDDH
ncbi:MAG TPA: zinc ABC transporter substrate-binding protein, partial [Acidimicrobiaceae bacterium]|nr:zinc ABC transporter substrate-binding protein [Acidimicrobiaceae bacterium]